MPYYGISNNTLYISNNSTSQATTYFSYPEETHRYPWSENTIVTSVVIQNKITPSHAVYFFKDLSNVVSITGAENMDLSNVRNMERMFENCNALVSVDVSNWNTSNVTNMMGMFNDCYALSSLDVSKWDTGKVTTFEAIFNECSSLTTLAVDNWNVSNAITMEWMFNGCTSLDSLNVGKWNTSKVQNMKQMFASTRMTELDVSNLNTSNVTNMSNMFYRAYKLTSLDVSKWDTSKVTTMNGMFKNCRFRTLNLQNWDISKVTDMTEMFASTDVSPRLSRIYCSKDWSKYNVTNSSDMFSGCTSIRGNVFYDSNKTDINYANIEGYFTASVPTRKEYVSSPINQLIQAIDTDYSVYNGTGYKYGYRVNSSGAAVEADYYVTGYIPVYLGTVIYLHNIILNKEGQQRVSFYDADFNHIVQMGCNGIVGGMGAVANEDENIIEFPIAGTPNGVDITNVAYIRFNAKYIGSDSIITLSTPIQLKEFIVDELNLHTNSKYVKMGEPVPLSWFSYNETDQYVLERSVNNEEFEELYVGESHTGNGYSTIDVLPDEKGIVQYRLKAINDDVYSDYAYSNELVVYQLADYTNMIIGGSV